MYITSSDKYKPLDLTVKKKNIKDNDIKLYLFARKK